MKEAVLSLLQTKCETKQINMNLCVAERNNKQSVRLLLYT